MHTYTHTHTLPQHTVMSSPYVCIYVKQSQRCVWPRAGPHMYWLREPFLLKDGYSFMYKKKSSFQRRELSAFASSGSQTGCLESVRCNNILRGNAALCHAQSVQTPGQSEGLPRSALACWISARLPGPAAWPGSAHASFMSPVGLCEKFPPPSASSMLNICSFGSLHKTTLPPYMKRYQWWQKSLRH